MTARSAFRAALAAVLAVALVGCAGSDRPEVGGRAHGRHDQTGYQVAAGEELDHDLSYRAVATGTLYVYVDPDLEAAATAIRGDPVVLPILEPYNRHEGWYPVRLPARRGGGEGWVLAEQVLAERVSYSLTAKGTDPADGGGTLAVYPSAGASQPSLTLSNPVDADGAKVAPVVVLARGPFDAQAAWNEVFLPVRPNGSTGWIRTADVDVLAHTWRVRVSLGAHRIQVWDGDRSVMDAPIGVGTSETPTPGGLFYIKSLIASTNPVYGPYAYGLSGFSDVHESFNGGPGDIGIHGTNDDSTVGGDVSNGCIRLHNADITTLAQILPYGTPVEVRA